jgi:hypothetical protein
MFFLCFPQSDFIGPTFHLSTAVHYIKSSHTYGRTDRSESIDKRCTDRSESIDNDMRCLHIVFSSKKSVSTGVCTIGIGVPGYLLGAKRRKDFRQGTNVSTITLLIVLIWWYDSTLIVQSFVVSGQF